MLILPESIVNLLDCFAPVFSKRVWRLATVLLVGAILTPGKRMVSAALRVMGLSDEAHFQNYHRVLSRAVWASRQLSRILLCLLLDALVPPDTPIVEGIDETLQRRWGAKIAARGIYRDAVRSSKEFFVKASGLRWICLMLLAPIPWIGWVWALPFFAVLAPSER
jgi:DDE superfamily endonuclease